MTNHDACHTRENVPQKLCPARGDQHRSEDSHKHDMRSWRCDIGMKLSCFSLEHLVQT